MNDSCRLNCDYILLFNNSDSSIGGGTLRALTSAVLLYKLLCSSHSNRSTFINGMLLPSLLNCWHIFLSFPNLFLYGISFNCKKGTRNGETLSVRMHICSPKVLTFLRKISNGWANSTLQWHVSLNSDYYIGRRGFTSVVQLNAFPSVMCTEAGGMWRTECPHRAPDRCWRVNLDLHSQIHFSGYMLPKPNSVTFRCRRLFVERLLPLSFLSVCPRVSVRYSGTDFPEILN